MIIAVPDSKFSITYLMDWDHPKIGRKWQTFDASKAPEEITTARTFASLKEHQLLGLADDSVSLTEDGFTKPLHFEDEPVRQQTARSARRSDIDWRQSYARQSKIHQHQRWATN